MFGSAILEVAMGLIVVYIFTGSICSAIREAIESWLKTRAAYLEHGIRQLLDDKSGNGLASTLYQHPMIYGLFQGDYTPGKEKRGIADKGKNLPSYIPARNFAMAMMDIAAKGATGDTSVTTSIEVLPFDSIKNGIAQIDNEHVKQILQQAVNNAQGDINKLQTSLERWYDSGMDRVSGWYKRSTQRIIFFIALVATIALNVNTIKIVSYLSKDQAAQKLVVDHAVALHADSANIRYQDAKAQLSSVGLPMGWDKGMASATMNETVGGNCWNWLLGPLLGWLFTAFAATLGAPFWFDMLNKVMVIRSTVKPHEKSGEEGSEDRPVQPAK